MCVVQSWHIALLAILDSFILYLGGFMIPSALDSENQTLVKLVFCMTQKTIVFRIMQTV